MVKRMFTTDFSQNGLCSSFVAKTLYPGHQKDKLSIYYTFRNALTAYEQHMFRFVNIATVGSSPANSGRRLEQQQSMSFQIVA